MPNEVMEHTFTDEKTCDDQTTQQDTSNDQVADIGIACFVASPGLFAGPAAPIHDYLCPPFSARGQDARAWSFRFLHVASAIPSYHYPKRLCRLLCGKAPPFRTRSQVTPFFFGEAVPRRRSSSFPPVEIVAMTAREA